MVLTKKYIFITCCANVNRSWTLNFCVKSVRIQSFCGSYFPAFGLNADQNNFEYERLLRSDIFPNDLLTILYSDYLLKYKKTLRITFWIRQRCSLFDNWNPCTSGIFNKVLFWLRKEATQPRLNFTKKNPFFQFKKKHFTCRATSVLETRKLNNYE